MADLLGRWTCNPKAPSSIPSWPHFVLVSPKFKSSALLVKQLTGLPPTIWNSFYVPVE